MDTNELRRLASEVDEEHAEAMRTLRDDIGALVLDAPEPARRSRRAFFRAAGLGGAAITVGATTIALPAMVASAQTTTTAPPQQPTTDDLELLAFAQTLELAAVEAYGVAAGKGVLSEAVASVALTFQSHHRDHAEAHAAIIGPKAPGFANESVLAAFGPALRAARDEKAILEVAFELETVAASTYLLALGVLEGTNAASAAAAILPVESRHAAVLGEVLGRPLRVIVPSFETTDDAATPAQFPARED